MARPADRPFIRIHPMFFAMAFMLGGMNLRDPMGMVGWILVVFVGVLVHELGHAAMARAFGLHPWIELHTMGGTTFYERSEQVRGIRRIAISLAGPFAGFALGGLFLVGAPHLPPLSGPMTTLVEQVIWVNIGWGLFNLLPILPLDGGHVMESVAVKLAPIRGALVARWISLVLGAVVALWAALHHDTYIALLFGFFAFSNFTAARSAAAAIPRREDPPRAAATPDVAPGDIETSIRNGETAVAVDAAKARVGAARTPQDRREAARLLVYAYYADRAFDRARVVLETMLDGVLDDPFLVGNIYLGVDDYEGAVAPLRKAYERKPNKDTGRWLVRALARSGRIDEARTLVEGVDAPIFGQAAHADIGEALFRAKQYEACAEWEERMASRWGDPDAAYNVACSMAQLGRVDDGIGWLERAIDRGFSDANALDRDEDIASLRADPRFETLRRRVRPAAAAS